MRIAIPREAESEPRVAATPETVKKMKTLGADVAVEAGAGVKSGILDSDYEGAGASLHAGAAETVADADVVLKVRRPSAEEVTQYKRDAIVIAMMDPYGNEAALQQLAEAGVAALAMELLPPSEGVYAALAATTAFLMVGHRSVYASQKLGFAKSAALEVNLGGAIGEFDVGTLRVRKGSLTDRIHGIGRRRKSE
jgi:NAD(P) transhydrogenase subunit alpha